MTTPKSDIRQANNGGKVAESKLTPAMERLASALNAHMKGHPEQYNSWLDKNLIAAIQAVLDELRASVVTRQEIVELTYSKGLTNAIYRKWNSIIIDLPTQAVEGEQDLGPSVQVEGDE